MLENKRKIQFISKLLILALFATSSFAYGSSWGRNSSFDRFRMSSFRSFEQSTNKKCKVIAGVFVVAAAAIVGVVIYFAIQGESATALSTRVALTECEWQDAETRAGRFSELLSVHNCSQQTNNNATLSFGTTSLCALFQERWEFNLEQAALLFQSLMELEAQQS